MEYNNPNVYPQPPPGFPLRKSAVRNGEDDLTLFPIFAVPKCEGGAHSFECILQSEHLDLQKADQRLLGLEHLRGGGGGSNTWRLT